MQNYEWLRQLYSSDLNLNLNPKWKYNSYMQFPTVEKCDLERHFLIGSYMAIFDRNDTEKVSFDSYNPGLFLVWKK
jgi:hypothetical protein